MTAAKSRYQQVRISASQTVDIDLLQMIDQPIGRGGRRMVVSYRSPEDALRELLQSNKISEAELLYGLSALNSSHQKAESSSERKAG